MNGVVKPHWGPIATIVGVAAFIATVIALHLFQP